MTDIVRSTILRVSIDGREVTQRFSARARYDLTERVASASVPVPVVPSWARCFDPTTGTGSIVSIHMGPDEPHAYRRFLGYLAGIDRTLWPRSATLVCMGLLGRARAYEQPSADGVDLAGVSGAADQAMWGTLLDAAGLTQAYLNSIGASRTIQGTGTAMGLQVTSTDPDGNLTGPFAWPLGVSALDMGDRLDIASYPYRTIEVSGEILRVPIQIDHASASHTFTEGVDIFSAEGSEVWAERRNQVIVTGYDDGLGLGPVEYTHPAVDPSPRRIYRLSSDMLEWSTAAEALSAGNGRACETVARAIYPDQYRALVKLDMSTPSGEIIWPTQPVKVQGPGGIIDRLGISQILWTQAVECEVSERGEWTQHLTLLGGKTGTEPTALPPVPSFEITCDRELVISGGAEVALYVVSVRDTSVPMDAAISSRAWTATGGTPASGTGERFTTSYTDVSGKSISLTVTAADGQTATISKAIPAATSALFTRRPLYTAEKGKMAAFSGSAWAVLTPSADNLVVSNGPVWGAGDRVYYSIDYLATVSYSQPKAGTNVTSLWVETDVAGAKVLCGLADGSVYLSLDSGATWTSLGSPETSAIIKVIINRWATGQYFALTAAGYYDTVDMGATWSNRNPAPAGVTWYDVSHSWDRGYLVVGDDGAGNPYAEDSNGVAQTFPGGAAGLYAVAARIDGGYAVYDSAKHVYLTATAETAFVAATDLPAGIIAQPRGLWRDGAIPTLFYVAAGTGGAYKSIDTFGSAGGYYQIRAPGVGTCDVAADIRQIGADGLLGSGPVTPVTIYSDATSKVKSLWNGYSNDAPPTDWYTPGYSDAAWSAATEGGASGEITGATDIWASSLPDATQQILLRRTFTIGSGLKSACSYEFACDGPAEHWINGVHFASTVSGYTSPTTVTIPPEYLIEGTNVLAIHVQGAA